MNETNLLKTNVKSLSADQKKAMALLIKHRNQQIAKEPLYKHRFNNFAQKELREMKSDYRVLVGGNKVGKTDEMGFELVAMCKGKCEEFGLNFPHKPPLKIWYCGRDRNVLSDEPLASIKRYLKGEGIDHRTVYTGQTVNMIYIWDDKGNQSEIRFKPYNGEIGIFESANVHAVFMDEEPPRDIFSAIKPKIAVLPGYVWIAMTPDKGLTWTYDLFNGSDKEHGGLVKKGYLQKYHGTVFDNMLNFPVINNYEWVRYPIEWIEKIPEYEYKIIDGIMHVKCSDTFYKNLERYEFGTNEYLMRVLGHYVSFTGKVYPYDAQKNTFELRQLPDFSQLKFFGALDPGYSDECCYMLIGVDIENRKWVIDGFYESYLDSRDQARKIRAISEYWGVKPEMIVADNQIENRLPQKDAEKSHIQSIKDYYLDELGDHWTIFRCEELDKRDPHIKRDSIIKDMKDRKLLFCNFGNKLYYHQSELAKLEFAEGKKDRLKGKDHCDAALRMFYGANISWDTWTTSEEMKERKKVHPDYRPKNEPVY